jgi:hypothetical protein
VTGTIVCPAIGSCSAEGKGVIDVVDGALYDLSWANTGFKQCGVALQRTQ